ncbi:MAG: carbohydrate ABC transporter permease [Oscillospiraceae bacterium]|nr:carbohydrate ABC transporter permease [Oscillospiraceae bacterium]
MKHTLKSGNRIFKLFAYAVCIFLAVLSLMPFVIMIINSTRSTHEIQQHAISFIPSHYLMSNFAVYDGKTFDAFVGFKNSILVATCSTILTVYFSSLTAYTLVAYQWKLRAAFFTMILCVMMIPGQITSIGFMQFMYQIKMTNNFIPLIVPGVAAPATVFFMRQFMLASLPLELLDSARIDGSKEFYTFNRIVLPIMKPAMATQAIFTFVAKWNELFLPSVLLTNNSKYTMPIMVSLLRGDIYKVEHGAIYLGVTLSVIPLFIVYFSLSKYIIAGVALGGVKG